MPVDPPTEVVETFITRVADGKFNEAEEVIHPDGPFEGTGELLGIFSLMFADFLLQLILPEVPTEISNLTVVERGAQTAEVYAQVIIVERVEMETEIELQTELSEPADIGNLTEQWRIWNVDVSV